MSMKKKAFTLIEMLIVVVIIGILAAALIPRLQGVQGRARDVQRKTNLSQIGQGMGVYKSDTNSYSGAIASNMANSGALVPTYLASLPGDPMKNRTLSITDFGTVPQGQYGAYNTGDILVLGAWTEIKGSSNGIATAMTSITNMAKAQGLIKANPNTDITVSDGSPDLRYYYVQ